MPEINLLPIDLSVNSKSAKSASVIKKISIYLTILFVLVAVAGGALILFFSTQLQTINKSSDVLTQQIKSLEDTEQKLFLIKDRVDKIKLTQNEIDLSPSIENLNKILSNMPANVTVDKVSIDTAKTDFSVISTDSLGMASFLNQLVTSGTYKNLLLTDFLFVPNVGYTISLSSSNL